MKKSNYLTPSLTLILMNAQEILATSPNEDVLVEDSSDWFN